MAIETAEDRLAYFDTDEFGSEASWSGATVRGLFEDGYSEVLDTEGHAPTFTCRSADVTGIAHGDTLSIDSTSYTVRGVQPDGAGITLLILERA